MTATPWVQCSRYDTFFGGVNNIVTDGNATNANGEPLFTLQRDVPPGQGASIYTVSTLDINDGLYYQFYIIASNRQLNQSEIDNWNGTRLDCDVHIVDIDNNGPSFDTEPPGPCSGIGKSVERGQCYSD